MVREYIELKIRCQKELEKYYELGMDSISLLSLLEEEDKLIDKILGIDEVTKEIINEFVWNGYCDIIKNNGEEETLSTVDELVKIVEDNVESQNLTQDDILFMIAEDIDPWGRTYDESNGEKLKQ